MPPSTRIALHRAGAHWIALALEGITEHKPERLELSPGPRSPIVWKFRDGDLSGTLLNVIGWLDGGMVSVSTQGTLYVLGAGRAAKALYLPGPVQHVDLGAKPPRTLVQDGRKQPLFPESWPKGAVRQVIRRRLRTLIILSQEFLFAELDGGAARAPASNSASAATPKDGG